MGRCRTRSRHGHSASIPTQRCEWHHNRRSATTVKDMTRVESFYTAAYWGARQETVEACAARVQNFLTAIETLSPDFSGWRKKGRSKKEALASGRINAHSHEALVALLSKGRSRKDVGADVIAELGFSMSAWNGGDKESVSGLSITCGLYSAVGGLSNAVVLDLPQRFDIDSKEKIGNLLRAFAEAWEPDWAIVTSQSARDHQTGHGPYLDRALYISNATLAPPMLPSSAIRCHLADGTLYVA